jgi:hypothetical protein
MPVPRMKRPDRHSSRPASHCGRAGELSMRSDVIYPGPARVVLAAAQQLHEPDLIAQHGEEWLANLRYRSHQQQWRDAISLIIRGARGTRWAYDATHDPQPRAIVVGQALTALLMALGIFFLLFVPFVDSSWYDAFSYRLASNTTSIAGEWYLPLYLGLTGVTLFGPPLVAKRFRWWMLGGITVGLFVAWYVTRPSCFPASNTLNIKVPGEPPIRLSNGLSFNFFGGINISMWATAAGTMVVFAHRKVPTVIRALAVIEMAGILCNSPFFEYGAWGCWFVNQLLLIIEQLSPIPLIGISTAAWSICGCFCASILAGAITLFCAIAIRAAWQGTVIAKSLIWTARPNIGGTQACL